MLPWHLSGPGSSTDGEDEKGKMKMKEKVVSKDLELPPARSSSRSPVIGFPADDAMHRPPRFLLGPKPAAAGPELDRTNMASNESMNDRMMSSGVYPCRFCSKQFLSYKAQVVHHTAHERQRAYEKHSRAFMPSSFLSYSPYGPYRPISRQAIYQSCSSLLRARLEFMTQKKPLSPWSRFLANHGGLQPLQQELAMQWRNQWVHRPEALSLELTIGRSNDNQPKGSTHNRFVKRQEASRNNIFIDQSGLDLTLKL